MPKPPGRLAALTCLWLFICLASKPASAGRYEFDPRRTDVSFSFTLAFATERAHFTEFLGTVDIDEKTPEKSAIAATFATASVTTGQPIIDIELKGPAFLNAANAPAITFLSRSVRANTATRYEVVGDLTMNAVTKSIVLDVSFHPHDDPALVNDAGTLAFVAKSRVKRSAFNMTAFAFLIGDDIDIEINAIIRPHSRSE